MNKNITETIKTGNVNAFSMLNNGITVVTSSIIISGDIATIEDYQIVNGCQTSNVLIENMDSVEGIDELIIPIRIIATKDENLKNYFMGQLWYIPSVKAEEFDDSVFSDIEKRNLELLNRLDTYKK